MLLQETGSGLHLADLKPIAGFSERQMSEEGVCVSEMWVIIRGLGRRRRLTEDCVLAGSQLELDRGALPGCWLRFRVGVLARERRPLNPSTLIMTLCHQ